MTSTKRTVSMQEIYQRLNTTPQELAAFCEKWQIVELALFGSVLRDDFRATGDDPSDIDILYVLAESSGYSLFDIMEMRENLERLFQRKVDLVSKNALQRSRNWLRRQEILKLEVTLYAKRSAIFN
ncbi:MAG: DNA polymerase subunit beta [Leptolyngbyaceae cyanobacterium RM2_2_4]|nr:DNA polymerase subunit beta [Leptolyngbyaceae cyanobacterium SM1_4_3]NJN89766.1 DNA polymerase subunit beta [Leptolyngbyaceae cyanobacterium SL_5_14]NJO52182.1 DNA polymerase subunit beta [Leptolyngbyaceae cyanobacterium RM2_2_4]NJO66230.1 DNA polymerase subunit beta [Leptolyngbyaceae cyanobacterium RM1_405_57]